MYTVAIALNLGESQTGLTLTGQLVDTAGANSGAPITVGFVEVGLGYYMWTGTFVDEFRGGIKFLDGATLKAFTSINPEEATSVLTAAECNKIADHVRRRNQTSVKDSPNGDEIDLSSLYGFIQAALKSDAETVPGKIVVYNPDGTELGRKDVTATPGAQPITRIN